MPGTERIGVKWSSVEERSARVLAYDQFRIELKMHDLPYQAIRNG